MPADAPDQLIELFVKFYNSRDVETLVNELYDDEAVMLAMGERVEGKAAIKASLEGFTAMGGTMTLLGGTSVECGDLALTHSRWRLEIEGADPIEATTAEVVRRQADGSWKYLIDNPFGGAVLDA